jgi:hypothetical protein
MPLEREQFEKGGCQIESKNQYILTVRIRAEVEFGGRMRMRKRKGSRWAQLRAKFERTNCTESRMAEQCSKMRVRMTYLYMREVCARAMWRRFLNVA